MRSFTERDPLTGARRFGLEVRCSRCERTTTFRSETTYLPPWKRITELHAVQRYLPSRQAYASWCRECERAQARDRRSRGGRRERRFGIEIEAIFPADTRRTDVYVALQAAGVENWRVMADCSLQGNGLEIISPPLIGEGGLEQVQKVCQALQQLNAGVNTSCGLHVHYDLRGMRLNAIKRFVRSYFDNQDLIDGLVSNSRRGPAANRYCRPLHPAAMTYIDGLQALNEYALDRYRTINLASYGRHGTVEIRQHQGTINYKKIRSWVLFGLALLDTSQRGSLENAGTIRGLIGRLGNLLDEATGTFLLDRAVRFGYATV